METYIDETKAGQARSDGRFWHCQDCRARLSDLEATTKYDGSPVLKVDGIFMAGLATHPSAEPDTLVVRAGLLEPDKTCTPRAQVRDVWQRKSLATKQGVQLTLQPHAVLCTACHP
jgi:hypothetical protein